VCGSGLEAIILGARALALNEAELIVAGGMESMSLTPYLLPGARKGFRLGDQQSVDTLIHDGLWDPYDNIHMGRCADIFASAHNLGREEQDDFASESYRRANTASDAGLFRGEIAPVEFHDRTGTLLKVESDEGPSKVDYFRISTLKPAFSKDGTVTAANASSLSDGAAAVVLKRSDNRSTADLKPLAEIVSYASYSGEPSQFLSAPVFAAKSALHLAGWSVDNVDMWEVNEAFAVVPLIFSKEMGIEIEKINPKGGAIALGHPLGASGARILVSLLEGLKMRGGGRGLATICIGGGESLAMCIEMVA
jgi:acetyl-CoA C-acetyltransferase